jgi:hypothetical protein
LFPARRQDARAEHRGTPTQGSLLQYETRTHLSIPGRHSLTSCLGGLMTRSTRLCHTSLTWLKAENIPPRPSSPMTPRTCSQTPGLSATVPPSLRIAASDAVLVCGQQLPLPHVSSRIRLGSSRGRKTQGKAFPTLSGGRVKGESRRKECSRHLF